MSKKASGTSLSEAKADPICIEPCPPSRFAVRIILETPANLSKTSLGVALSENGIYATIYYKCIDEYARERITTQSQILGYAIAHEMGHLLLGPAPHGRFGSGGWTAEDLRSITMGALLFSPPQPAMIRQAAMRRMRSQEGPAPALPFVGQ